MVFLFAGVPDIMQSSKRKGACAVKQFDVIREAAQQGLPGELMLIFTAVIWCIFTLILLADLHNRLNNWCFISGMMFSIGALKEYLFYTLGPQLIQAGSWTAGFSEGLYSVLSAVFYYLSMPSVLVFSFFFHRWNRQMGRCFYLVCIAAYAPAVILAFVFPCTQTMHFQHDSVFCLTVAGYNWGAGHHRHGHPAARAVGGTPEYALPAETAGGSDYAGAVMVLAGVGIPISCIGHP